MTYMSVIVTLTCVSALCAVPLAAAIIHSDEAQLLARGACRTWRRFVNRVTDWILR